MVDAQSARAEGAVGDALVKETTTAKFRADVIAESAEVPVLVDFWAPWCGPCRQLTPVLEKIVRAAQGKVKLVKMNIDEHPQIAGQLGIQSIPAVIAFQKGKPVDGFMGALPESQVKSFIDRLTGPQKDPVDQLLEEAATARDEGDVEFAEETYRAILTERPGDARAAAGLGGVLVTRGDLVAAREVLEKIPQAERSQADVASAFAALELSARAEAVGDAAQLEKRVQANPDDHQARFDLAVALNARGSKAEAADQLLASIRRDLHWNEDAARKQLLQFFEAWGPTDLETIAARRRLSAILFS